MQHRHGTHQCYRSCGCREQECKDANAAETRAARRRRNYGTAKNYLVDAKPVRKHLKKLAKQGWGVRAVSRETGVSESVLKRLFYAGAKNDGQVIRAVTSEKLLAFNPLFSRTRFQGTSTETVIAIGSQRRLQALVTLGFSLNALADYAGYGRSYFKAVLASERISLNTANIVTEVYERLWNKKPLPETGAQKQSVTNAKRIAAEKGWLPPMAWDDDRIDDPKYKAWGQREVA
jgi:AraC-like DNA-binding protein